MRESRRGRDDVYLLKGERKRERERRKERERAILDGRRRRRETNYHTTFLCSGLRWILLFQLAQANKRGMAWASQSHLDSGGVCDKFTLHQNLPLEESLGSQVLFTRSVKIVTFTIRSTLCSTKLCGLMADI